MRLVPGGAGPSAPRDRRRPELLLRVAVGQVLRAERAEQRRTLADVAATARVSLPYLSEVERGRKEPSSEVLAAVCEALDLTLVDLLQRTGTTLAGAASTGRSGVTLSLAA
ncbi:helix-turn-helix domain-containing protein [Kineococcus sp. R8]|nr:helix-turn-helix domain-containing protein [Kineococcus siccus]